MTENKLNETKITNIYTETVQAVTRSSIYSALVKAKRPAIFATDEEHRTSEHCDAVPWSVIEEVLK